MSSLFSDVKFVLSGYQNPARGNVRAKAMDMGAKYYSDWGKHCTHLICAFKGTPKYNQVLQERGKIVTDKWILDSYKDKTRHPWKKYRLDSGGNSDDSEDEIQQVTKHTKTDESEVDSADEIETIKNRALDGGDAATGSDEDYGGDTDVDDEDEVAPMDTAGIPLPRLPDVFHKKAFYIHTSTSTHTTKHLLRYITACGGVIVEKSRPANYIV